MFDQEFIDSFSKSVDALIEDTEALLALLETHPTSTFTTMSYRRLQSSRYSLKRLKQQVARWSR
ncbi:hypothetical protein [uncultured Mobiluncus sp.]|uniref:hypothetical protein n=1 Tax=uncultured Mobiluncus sp. TaxID=293425 RepID=UPI0026024CED|nr:hypothetical protein [uncultured Mobiluncus sp.]